MKIFRIAVAVAVLPFASYGDVSSGSPVSATRAVDTAIMKQQRDETVKIYLRGVQLAEGDGVLKDLSAAAGFYRKAAEAGYAPAQYDLATLYESGGGVETDLKQAAIWYRKAADQGHAEAQNNLGALYSKGQGVPRNEREAVRWYRLATKQKDPEATSNLGIMYLRGRGVKRNFAQAFELFRRAAEQDYAAAQNNLALMYANGQGVTRDFVAAYAWLDIAAAKLSASSGLRDQIGREMTPDDIARARDLANRKREELAQKEVTPP